MYKYIKHTSERQRNAYDLRSFSEQIYISIGLYKQLDITCI